MEKKKTTELIKLEVLGNIGVQESEALHSAKLNDKDFPWEELGDYQNLAALLSATLETETPVQGLKDEIVLRLASLLYENKAVNEEEKVVKELETELTEIESELVERVKAPDDFLPLKDPDLSQLHILYGDQGLKPKPHKIKEREAVREQKIPVVERFSEVVEEEKVDEDYKEYAVEPASSFKQKEVQTNANDIGSLKKNLKRSLVISAGLFVVTVVLVVFIFLKFSADDNKQEAKRDATENILLAEENKVKLPEETQVAVTVGEIEKVGNIQKEESKEKLTEEKTTDKQSGPPPLPKSLVPIEAPLIDETQNTVNNNVETDSRQKNVEISNVPPKEEKKVVEEPTYFVAVEEMPEPIGGLKGIQEKIVYPEIAKRMGVEGKVHVQAFVDESGRVTDVQVIKGIGAGCDEAALDAVLKTKFKPGKQRGKPVRVQITIPINFKL